MCTAVFKNRFLSRTVDRIGDIGEHFIIGRCTYIGGVIRNEHGEVWIDGMNSHGLMTALLNYRKEITDECTCCGSGMQLHPGKLVPFLLENCRNVQDASDAVLSMKLTSDEPEMYPHFIIADRTGGCVTFESGRNYENTVGVLTNAPSFPEQIAYLHAHTADKKDHYASESRFERMVRLRERVKTSSIVDCFDLLTTVAVPEGADDRPGYRTILRSVMSADSMTYSYAAGCSGKIRTVPIGGEFEFSVDEGTSSK